MRLSAEVIRMAEQLERLRTALADSYRVERELGRGGMSTVYEARDLKHDRRVAIKVLRAELAAHLGPERFLREIRLTANLQHPHIVPVYDSGEAAGLLYYVMPFVEGESLRARLDREGRIPLAESLRIARQVATALAFAHERMVIHRDVKPENILLTGGTALVADFGVARATEAAGGDQLTAVGLAVGTPAYMSPEQASGESNVDGRSDLYSLGCVLYEMLAGEPPFGYDTPQRTLSRQVMKRAPSLSAAAAQVPHVVSAVVGRLLAKEPAERYDSAQALVAALDTAAPNGLASALGSGPWWTALMQKRPARVVVAYVAAGLILVALAKWLAARLMLSPDLPMLTGLTFLLLLPSVVLLAYRRRHDGWTLAEKAVLPVNAVLAVAVLFLAFGGRNLGATTTALTLRDEEGNLITRRVPKEGFRKNVLLFFFDNPQNDTSLTWLQYGIPLALRQDLLQDPFFFVEHPEQFMEELAREGFGDGLGVPLPLQRRIADGRHFEWFLTGAVARAGDDVSVTTRLYRAGGGRLVAEHALEGADGFAVVDQITEALKADLDVPAAQVEESTDLPVAEVLTGSLPAYRDFIEGYVSILRFDPQAAITPLERAVRADTTFALAYLQLFVARLMLNQDDAGEALERARRLAYKLPESQQLWIKAEHYQIQEQDAERALAVTRMHVELYPHDLQARRNLAAMLETAGRYDSAAAELLATYALDTTRYETLLRVGQLAHVQGQDERALDYFHRYADRFPEDPNSYTNMAMALARLGDHDQALQLYDRARVLAPDNVQVLLGSASLLADVGRFDEAVARFDDAQRAAATPDDRAAVFESLRAYHDRRGQLSLAVEFMERSWAEGGTAQVPLYAVLAKLERLGQYARAGQVDVARDTLRALRARLTGLLGSFAEYGRMSVAVESEDADSIDAVLPQVDSLIARFSFAVFRAERERSAGLAHELRGRCDAAILSYRRALESQPMMRAARLGLARCERAVGDLDQAEARLEELLRARPYHPIALYERAQVHRARGEEDEAVRLLERAMRVLENAEPACVWAQRTRQALAALR
jgi:tetratricopeptide (TPR) repeat protein/tRNA A-37 threonylcarbamoyl transferase component Bud32